VAKKKKKEGLWGKKNQIGHSAFNTTLKSSKDMAEVMVQNKTEKSR